MGNHIIINMDNLKAFGKITQLIPEKIDKNINKDKQGKSGTKSARGAGKKGNKLDDLKDLSGINSKFYGSIVKDMEGVESKYMVTE